MNFPYDLTRPSKVITLQKEYDEISGICPVDDDTNIAFVQDEAIQVHHSSLLDDSFIDFKFHAEGDSEDLTIIGESVYILHAGDKPSLYRIDQYKSPDAVYWRYDLDLDESFDPEGLCFDSHSNQLLIACKGAPGKESGRRNVYSFNLESELLHPEPKLIIDSNLFLYGASIFNPSSIAIHPHTRDIYLVGTKGVKMIICYANNGIFKGAWGLNPRILPQPEGIAFLDSGRLVLCTEAQRPNKKEKKEGLMSIDASISFYDMIG